jgi:twinkle protein
MAKRKQSVEVEAEKTHLPCVSCGSSDALTLNTDGSTKCFSCGEFIPADGKAKAEEERNKQIWMKGFIQGEHRDITSRKIPLSICRKFDYTIGEHRGRPCQVANYRDPDGSLIGQKVRYPDKTFSINGKVNVLYGCHLWNGGRRLTITEGEIDSLSVATVFEGKWPVVSIPNGAQAAAKIIKANIDYLEQFEEVIFMFDMDEVGQEAAKECATLLSVGKAKIAQLPAKDPNELLKAGRGSEIMQAFWNAKEYRPDGIVLGEDLAELIFTEQEIESVDYPYSGLNDMTYGLRKGEIVTFAAGSGVGKSTVCRELAYDLIKKGQKVGYIALEENIRRSALGLMGIHLNMPLHLKRNVLQDVDKDALQEAFDATVGSGRYVTYDHWGSIESDNLIARIRYMHKALDCDYVFLDHVSIVVSGQDGDERKMIDILMTKLRSLVEETNVGLILVSHLKRPEGRGFEEGRQTTLGHLRGSAGLGQLSDIVIGVERDQQDEDVKNQCTIRLLKNRFSGETGMACILNYNRETGRLKENLEFSTHEHTTEDYNLAPVSDSVTVDDVVSEGSESNTNPHREDTHNEHDTTQAIPTDSPADGGAHDGGKPSINGEADGKSDSIASPF